MIPLITSISLEKQTLIIKKIILSKTKAAEQSDKLIPANNKCKVAVNPEKKYKRITPEK